MAYKDKEQQREANRAAVERYRKRKGMTQGMTDEGMTDEGVIPKAEGVSDLNPLGLPGSEMQHVVGAQPGHIINTGDFKTANELRPGEFNRVSLPGDADYSGVCNSSKYDNHRR